MSTVTAPGPPLATPISVSTPTMDQPQLGGPSAQPPISTTADRSLDTSHPPASAGGEATKDAQGQDTTSPAVPMVHLRVLVISGVSHVFTFEPETTVGRTKELIWSMWPSDWSSPAQPPSPSFLRILHAGRILGDDSTLISNNLPAALPPTNPIVIHLSVRSFSIREDDPKKTAPLQLTGSRSARNSAGGRNEVSGCKCVIM